MRAENELSACIAAESKQAEDSESAEHAANTTPTSSLVLTPLWCWHSRKSARMRYSFVGASREYVNTEARLQTLMETCVERVQAWADGAQSTAVLKGGARGCREDGVPRWERFLQHKLNRQPKSVYILPGRECKVNRLN